jgi:hypothetical protein
VSGGIRRGERTSPRPDSAPRRYKIPVQSRPAAESFLASMRDRAFLVTGYGRLTPEVDRDVRARVQDPGEAGDDDYALARLADEAAHGRPVFLCLCLRVGAPQRKLHVGSGAYPPHRRKRSGAYRPRRPAKPAVVPGGLPSAA